MNKSNKRIIRILLILIILDILLLGSLNIRSNRITYTKSNLNYAIESKNTIDKIYMSDLEYIKDESFNGWNGHNIQVDKNPEGNTINLIVDGKKKSFLKGMGIHANGELLYDISAISNEYSKFIARVGVDSSRDTNGSVTFKFIVSADHETWYQLYETDILKGNSESVYVTLDISGYKYFKIIVDKSINGNAADHGVVADAKFVKEDYEDTYKTYDKLNNLSYYDDILNKKDLLYNIENNTSLILKRELVRKIGYDNIRELINYDDKYIDLFDYILSDLEVLKEVVEVGEVNSLEFIKVLEDLYSNNKDIINNDVYRKMIIGLSATYSSDTVASSLNYAHVTPTYDYKERFNIYKKLYDDGLFGSYKEAFENYKVELMRIVMSDGARNDEIKWLNYYTRINNNNESVYKYVNHIGHGTGYNDEEFHSLLYKDKWDTLYKLSEYGVPIGDNILRYWMVINKGGICWNQSRVFQSLFNSIGRPTIGIYQPGHEAVLYYIENSDGTGTFNIANNIFGWGKSGTSWYGAKIYRTIFNWANKPFINNISTASTSGYSASYVYLEQDNINNYDLYEKSYLINLLANSYQNKISIYNESLNIWNLNLDTYDYLIKEYEKNNVSDEEWYNLAIKIIDSYTYYPMAMSDLLKLIKPHLTNSLGIDIINKEHDALVKASIKDGGNQITDKATREVSKVLLGIVDSEIATFSFDGDNKNKIIFNDLYKDYDLSWHYSLDGGVTKSSSILDKMYELSLEEIESINEEDDILIYIDGLDINKPSYIIDITKKDIKENTLYNNDLENKVIGSTKEMEWRIHGTSTWISYKDEYPDLSGNTSVDVRYSRTGTSLPGNYITFDFTLDQVEMDKKYVPISYLEIAGVSSEATNHDGSAKNVIDGNYYTRWHSDWNGNDTERYITIKLKNSIHLSLLEYIPAGGGNGKIIDGKIEGSMDGVNFFLLGEMNNLEYTGNQNDINNGFENIKRIETDSTNEVMYVKITATNASNGNWFAARMFNLYQDSTKSSSPTGSLVYSTTSITNKDVTVKLIDYDKDNVTIISEGGSEHVFTDNGEFTFILRDNFTYNETKIVAKVDWIDKVSPVGKITYDTNSITNNNVTATLSVNEEVEILSDSLNDNPYKFIFVDNGEYTFKFRDKAGNIGYATSKVTWIDRIAPTASITYTKTNNNTVIAKVTFDKKNVSILNNNGLDYYEFTSNGEFRFIYQDQAGNNGSILATVDSIKNINISTSKDNTNTIENNLNKEDSIIKKENKEDTSYYENSSKSYSKLVYIMLGIIIVLIVLIIKKRKRVTF